ncbi:hypothetical protein VSH64_33975 [Amycolatopsis rhabdoformis]|uniref:Uncharacterized protein n=1 Tax=Amycolatopsis rhabdoformis TaxID=1448059 RepID=A0ABZ1I2C5_9PSEU|nr:hypothetical protein [Amycolatopsis rhabdoformis]WSE27829.1 hypothetical protein VSH64_33975 [Amycolatopsis rhabdoformis]
MELVLGSVVFLVAPSMIVACWRFRVARWRVGVLAALIAVSVALVAVLREPLALWVLALGPGVVIAVGRLAVEWWRPGGVRRPERLAGH